MQVYFPQIRAALATTLLLWLSAAFAYSQTQTQRIRGQVFDQDSRKPVTGASAYIELEKGRIGAITNSEGKFLLESVPVGRRSVVCVFPGYEAFISEDLILTSGREEYLNIFLVQRIGETTTEEVLITTGNFSAQPANDLSVVSARSFSAELTGRIPAAVNDPGRMALAFPGVQQGTDDSENDIIIRGNSSIGMLWRLEGLDIPTPNHFSRPGTSGGGLTVFSAQLIDRSDFSTGGMAAEYGNALSGVMDIHFRKGNMNHRQYRARVGLLGLDFATEGPIRKGRSSYLANYRASTLSLLNRMGFELVGERVDNDFSDFSFNLAFDGKNGRSFTTVFGLGGISLEHYRPIPAPENRGLGDQFRANEWEDRRQGSNMMALGVTHRINLDDKSYLKIAAAATAGFIFRNYDILDTVNARSRYRDEEHVDQRGILSLMYQRRLGPRTRIKTGIFAHQLFYRFYRETVARANLFNLDLDNVSLSARGDGQTQTFQYFLQASHALTDKLTLHAGGHFYWLLLNGRSTLDPRLSLQYRLTPRTTLAGAYGIHSQTLPMMLYFYVEEATQSLPNFDLPMMRAHHGILSFTHVFGRNYRFLAEGYVQRLFQIPVLRNAQGQWNDTTEFWLLNNRESVFDPFVSEGKGLNYGLDVSLEKTFSQGFFFLLNGSAFEATYELPDGRVFNTRFASRWTSSYTFGKEFYFGNRTLQAGFRVLYHGGMRYTPPDRAASEAQGRFVADRQQVNQGFVNPYFRIDSRVAWFWNSDKLSGMVTLDIQNLTDRKNTQNVGWNNTTQNIFFQNHPGGFIPVLSVQLDL